MKITPKIYYIWLAGIYISAFYLGVLIKYIIKYKDIPYVDIFIALSGIFIFYKLSDLTKKDKL